MAKPRKFREGDLIGSMSGLLDALDKDEWVFMWNRPKHAGFVLSMQLRNVTFLLKNGAFSKAIRIPAPWEAIPTSQNSSCEPKNERNNDATHSQCV